MIVFIACTKSKLDKECPAKEMYSASSYFRKCYAYAQSLKPNKIFILSAKYGLLNENDIIQPYEKTLRGAPQSENKSGQIWWLTN